MNDEQLELNQQEMWDDLLDWLHQGVVTVTFEKKNGETRVMNCTLQEEYYSDYDFKGTDDRVNESVVGVWDVDIDAWRMIRYGSLISLEWFE